MDRELLEKERVLYDYHKHNLIYINDYIKFADAKAGVALGANLLMLGFYGQQLKNTDFWSLFLRSDVQLLLVIAISVVVLTLLIHFFIFNFIGEQIQKNASFLNFSSVGSYLFLFFYSIISSFTIAYNTSIFTIIFKYEKEYIAISTFQYNTETLLILFLILGLISLVVSCYYLLLKVLWPRYSLETDYYMSWGGISAFNDADKYIQKLDLVDYSTFVNDMAKQNHALSKVCAKKYINLRVGFWYLIVGALLTTLCWFLIEIK
ncbi:Pycsar system effector family protein [Exiguobacterium sp. s28]|uniref:Pycsar system effector family protein n=1 Tax=Exiguobacterium sp. s28 TaxID=2751238 RepID=UPI001BE53877|nr:Pycsar system effector family protein [Exiguobacterium sp. s28]